MRLRRSRTAFSGARQDHLALDICNTAQNRKEEPAGAAGAVGHWLRKGEKVTSSIQHAFHDAEEIEDRSGETVNASDH